MSLTPAQLAVRADSISASEVGAILGVNPYRSRIDVWRERRGEIPAFAGNPRSKWGDLLEPVIRDDYAERHGVTISVPGTMVHPARDWCMASPDGLAYRGHELLRGVEIKTHSWRASHLYGAPGSDEVPLWELAQCMWSMYVTGLARWDLVAFIDGQPTDYVIARDGDTIAGMVEACERFLRDNIRGGQIPAPDGSDGYDRYLAARWRKTTGVLREASDEEARLIGDAHALLRSIGDGEAKLDEIKQRLKCYIGDADGLAWRDADGKARNLTWKWTKAGCKVDHARQAGDMRNDALLAISAMAGIRPDEAPRPEDSEELRQTLDRIASRTDEQYTIETPPQRRFCWPRGWAKEQS